MCISFDVYMVKVGEGVVSMGAQSRWWFCRYSWPATRLGWRNEFEKVAFEIDDNNIAKFTQQSNSLQKCH